MKGTIGFPKEQNTFRYITVGEPSDVDSTQEAYMKKYVYNPWLAEDDRDWKIS